MPPKSYKLSNEYILAIRNYMARFNLTQKELAARAWIGLATFQNLLRECKTSEKTLTRLRKIWIVEPHIKQEKLPETLEINGTVYKKVE